MDSIKPGDICVFATQSTSADTGRTETLRYDVVVHSAPYTDFYGTKRVDVQTWDGSKGTGYPFTVAVEHLRKKKK